MRRPLVVHLDQTEQPLTLEREALADIDCEIISAAVESQDQILAAIRHADVVLDDHSPITRETIGQLERCGLIIRYGHGYEGVDLDACTEHGIMVANVPGSTSEEVSNHALALMFACARELKRFDKATSDGRWGEVYSRSVGQRIFGQTAGVVGFGWIGRSFARKAKSMGMDVLVHDPYVGEWLGIEYQVSFVSFDELLERSDFISIHSQHDETSHHLFNVQAFDRMKSSAYLINTARGGIVDEAAMIDALRAGKIAGGGLDVFEVEPVATDNPLLHMENVVVTPHVAGSSEPGWAAIRRRAGEDAARYLRGERPHGLVNLEVLGRLRHP